MVKPQMRNSNDGELAKDISQVAVEAVRGENLLGLKFLDRFPIAGHALLIVAVSSMIFFCGLGDTQLWDRDEPRNAGCAVEMMARGDWVVPIFNDELRPQKPALLYWLMMSAYSLFGVSEFSARFWSAILAVATTLATFGIGRRLFDAATGFLAAIILASSLMFCVAARAATPDSLLIFCVTMAIYFFVRGLEPDLSAHRVEGKGSELSWFPARWTFSFFGTYLMLGLAILAKGPAGFVLPMAVIGMFMLLQRLPESNSGGQEDTTNRSRLAIMVHWMMSCLRPFYPLHFVKTLFAMRPVAGTLIALLVAAPWFVWVGLRTEGDFLIQFFLNENLGRATTVLEDHRGGLWFYPLAILVGFFPWSVFWGPVAIGFFSRRADGLQRISSGEVLMMSWIAVQVTAFSLVQTKLPSYVTPCYPALAILTAYALLQLQRFAVPMLVWKIASCCLAGTGLAISIGFIIASQYFFPQHAWLAVLGVVPVLVGVTGAIQLQRLSKDDATTADRSSGMRKRHFICAFSIGAILFCLSMFGFGTSAIGTYQQNQKILCVIRELPDDFEVASYGRLESSWTYYGERPVFELSEQALPAKTTESELDESQQGKVERRAKTWKPKVRMEPQKFVDTFGQVVIITTEDRWGALKNRLPDDFEVIQTAEYFLKDKQLVLVGRINSSLASLPNAMEQANDKPNTRH